MKTSNDAQAVIIKKEGESFLFLVIQRFDKDKQEDHYRLVKGGVKKGESSEAAVKREVLEEVGLSNIGHIDTLCHYGYTGGEIRHEVDVFIVWTQQGDNVKVDSVEEGGFTIKNAVWMSAKDAIDKLSFQDEKNLITEALKKALY